MTDTAKKRTPQKDTTPKDTPPKRTRKRVPVKESPPARKPARRKSTRRRKKAGHPMLLSFALGISIGVAVCAIIAMVKLYHIKEPQIVSKNELSPVMPEKQTKPIHKEVQKATSTPVSKKAKPVKTPPATEQSLSSTATAKTPSAPVPNPAPTKAETKIESKAKPKTEPKSEDKAEHTAPPKSGAEVALLPANSAPRIDEVPPAPPIVSPASKKEVFPPAINGARLAVVFDDAGGDVPSCKYCLALPFPITVAVMPGLSHSRECADAARAAGAEVLLHQPMQAQNLNIKPGVLAVTPSMSAKEAASLVVSNMVSLGQVAGVNNHEGSLITENTAVMAAIMKAAQEKGAYFLDSRTTSGTKAGNASSVTGIPYYERDVFLDNSHDKEAIVEQVRRALDIANRDGAAIMIGHVRADDILADTLKEIAPLLRDAGYVFCTVSNTGALLGQ